jgi:hypothetical protein
MLYIGIAPLASSIINDYLVSPSTAPVQVEDMIEPTPQEPQPQDDDASNDRSAAKQDMDGQDHSNPCTAAPLPQSINGYSCIAFERADYTLSEFLVKNKRKLDNIARQGVIHQILKGINWLHCHGVWRATSVIILHPIPVDSLAQYRETTLGRLVHAAG